MLVCACEMIRVWRSPQYSCECVRTSAHVHARMRMCTHILTHTRCKRLQNPIRRLQNPIRIHKHPFASTNTSKSIHVCVCVCVCVLVEILTRSALFAAVGGSGRTATSASGATGGWSAAGGARTSGGSTLKRTGGGAAVSTRPRFYGGGGFRGRPILYGAVALWLFYPRGGMSGRTCPTGQFKYGRECRTCSDWDCPIGQFRSICTPHTDSYCKLCANAPPDADGVSYIYTSPGNNNDCEYRAADPADSFIADGFQADEVASLIMFLEIPTSKAQFNADGTKLSEAIASVAGACVRGFSQCLYLRDKREYICTGRSARRRRAFSCRAPHGQDKTRENFPKNRFFRPAASAGR